MKPIRFIDQMNTNSVATYGNQIRIPSSGRPPRAIWFWHMSYTTSTAVWLPSGRSFRPRRTIRSVTPIATAAVSQR